ncbi:hypothetical protein [Microbulbifer taiwanensis]|uniref:Uncharacterized protein n=1 Tax=Microbulbifer taiwanensis TaxID=986746 RepID=A0ABW1YLJ0_9GAMM|nr:hypothetical protein [Microbulbifer taiwanensis]
MIIATINHTEYKLDSMKDAENLLQILSRATEIDKVFIGRKMYFEATQFPRELGIAIVPSEITSPAELEVLREQDKSEEEDR